MAGGIDPVKAKYLNVLQRANVIIRSEASWLEKNVGGDNKELSGDMVRVTDRGLLQSAVDLAIAEGGETAHERLGFSPSEMLKKHAKAIKGTSVLSARQNRLQILHEWGIALGHIIREISIAQEKTLHECLDLPTLKHTPRAPQYRHGYKGELLLSVLPVEITQVLYKRAAFKKRQREGAGLAEEDCNLKAKLQRNSKSGRSLCGKKKPLPLEINPTQDQNLIPMKHLNMYCYSTARVDTLHNIAEALHKQKNLSSMRQEKDDEQKRQRVARALNKAVSSFWEHTTKIIKQTTNDHKERRRREILEGKKDLLLTEAKSLANTLAEDLKKTKHEDGKGNVELSPLLQVASRPLRGYQRSGLDWLVALHERGMSGILADEMGLGKTIQTISLLAHLATAESNWGPHLVVVPMSVLLNWEIEFKRWAPGFNILLYYGTQKARLQKRKGWTALGAFDVCIASYQTVVADITHFKRMHWEYMILDEAQMIKNWKSKKWQLLHELKTTRRLLLSGTPLQNNMMEVWSLLRFLLYENPLFASGSNFQHWFNSPMTAMLQDGECNTEVVQQLHQVLRPYILRRLKREVESEMPKKTERVLRCRLSKRQRTLYDEYIHSGETNAKLKGGYMGVMGVLMALRKVCNHPSLFEPRPTSSPFCPYYEPSAAVYNVMHPVGMTVVYPRLLRGIQPGVFSDKSVPFHFLSELQSPFSPSPLARSPHTIFKEISSCTLVGLQPLQNSISTVNDSSWKPYLAALHGLCQQGSKEKAGVWRRKQKMNLVRGSRMTTLLEPFFKETDLSEVRIPAEPATLNGRFTRLTNGCLTQSSTDALASNINRTTFSRFDVITPKVSVPKTTMIGLDDQSFELPVEMKRSVPSSGRQILLPDPKLVTFDCGKLQVLATLLPDLKRQGHRVLIFTQMTKVLDILEAFLSLKGFVYLRLDGSTKVEERQYRMELFNNDTRYFCFILSTRSGGMGINLTGADTVIFYDSDWNPAMDLQAQDRCHRIGQTRDVTVYRLTSKHTVEENILMKARQKKTLINVIIKGGQLNTDTLISDDKNTNLKLFFHHLDDDDFNRLQAEADAEADEATQDIIAQKIDVDPLIELEDEVDREAFKKVRAELNAANGEDAEEEPMQEQHDLAELLDPLQQYALRMFDEFSPLTAESMVAQTSRQLTSFEQRELKGIHQLKA
eukprot:TRINITY_DN8107_c0_g1_i2.p1 TRINITY_DN8107_c0_g1~~TRINITY_DN8107_c0_g1_i2.p1  ORF type:complete len:1181 (+),score=206.67 TRINITY_DN8107_c0_g1_i2:32-3574(+)